MGWDDAELAWRIRKSFRSQQSGERPDLAHGRHYPRRQGACTPCKEHFGDRTICDMWLPFFCVSTNLTLGSQMIHRQGLVREVLLASLSLPGVLPPVTVGDDVLVDGAILNNFPADVMRALHTGPIVGVDVGRGRSIEAADIKGPASIPRWLVSGAWRNATVCRSSPY